MCRPKICNPSAGLLSDSVLARADSFSSLRGGWTETDGRPEVAAADEESVAKSARRRGGRMGP